MVEPKEGDFGLEISKALIAKLVMAAIGFVGSLVLADLLGAAKFGAFYLLLALVEIVQQPVSGIANAAKKRFTEEEANEREILGATLLAITILVVLVGVVAFLLRGRLRIFTGIANAYFYVVLIFSALGFFVLLQQLVVGTGSLGAAETIDLCRSIVTTPLQILFVLFGYGPAGMAVGLFLATAVVIPISFRKVGYYPKIPCRKTVSHLWNFARYSVLTFTLGKSWERFDTLILGVLATQAVVGNYELAYKITLPVVFLSEIMGSGLTARVSSRVTRGKEISSDVTNTISYASLLSIPLFFGSLVISGPLINVLFQADFAAAATFLVGIALYRIIQTQSRLLGGVISGIDRPSVNFQITVVSFLVNVVVGVVLVIVYGPIGVVIGTIVAELLAYVLSVLVLQSQNLDISFFPPSILHQIVSGGIMYLLVNLVSRLVTLSSAKSVVGTILIGVLGYAVLLVTLSRPLRVTAKGIMSDFRNS